MAKNTSGKKRMERHDQLFGAIAELVMQHSPSGDEGEMDEFLRTKFNACGLKPASDASGNLIVKIPGQGGGRIAVMAHKDELGAIVTSVENNGRIRVRKLGGSFPWIYGEGVVDLLADSGIISGILSFGSRHVPPTAPQFKFKESAPLLWADAWIETKISPAELTAAGVRPGTRMVIGRHRKKPFRLKDYIASYAVDNRASLAILLELARRVKRPQPDVYLVASSKEEVGASGALYFTRRQEFDALIALEISPVTPEYPIVEGETPVLLAEDGRGLYDKALNQTIRGAATQCGLTLQTAVISGFGSDASNAMSQGHVGRAACLGFPTLNTHGYEITHLGAIENCIKVLEAVCRVSFAPTEA